MLCQSVGAWKVSHPNNKAWIADVTYIKHNNKWHNLATVLDRYSRRIIGWSFSRRKTTELTENALTYALKKRGYPTGGRIPY